VRVFCTFGGDDVRQAVPPIVRGVLHEEAARQRERHLHGEVADELGCVGKESLFTMSTLSRSDGASEVDPWGRN
jgi:hypothetical protein